MSFFLLNKKKVEKNIIFARHARINVDCFVPRNLRLLPQITTLVGTQADFHLNDAKRARKVSRSANTACAIALFPGNRELL